MLDLVRYDPPMPGKPRRRVDWVLIQGADATLAHLDAPSGPATGPSHITSALLSDSSAQAIDMVLRNTVEFARDAMGLERVAIYLVVPGGRSMVGAWGTDMAGRTTDEHELMYEMNDLLRKFFARSASGYPWSVYQDCPLVTHEGGTSRAVGRGWNAYTIIQGGGSPLGIMFNDTAISRAPFDESKQSQAALLCALLGHALAPCLAHFFAPDTSERKPQHPLVRQAAHLLASNPSWSFADLAKQLGVSKGHLTRTFRRFADTSIVEYRNELRLAEFLNQIKTKPVLEAALGAGFGSYAQFHRVFRARFGKPPREYLFEHRVSAPVDADASAR
jgi:AraC-like DNA-binding protein